MANISDCNSNFSYIFDSFCFVVYRIILIFYLTVGSSANFILLLAFHKQSKTEQAYGYQVAFTVSKTFEILSFGSYLLAKKWWIFNGYDWFISNYGLMQFSAISIGLHTSFIMSSLLLALAMACDRIFAIKRPLVHRNINHIRHQILASICCFLLSFLVCGKLFLGLKIIPEGDHYVSVDSGINSTALGRVWFSLYYVFRIGGVLLLVVLTFILIKAFQKRNKQLAAMTTRDEGALNDKMLLWANMYQACMLLVNQIPHASWNLLLFLKIDFCGAGFVGLVADSILMITDALDLFLAIVINRRMRRIVSGVIPTVTC